MSASKVIWARLDSIRSHGKGHTVRSHGGTCRFNLQDYIGRDSLAFNDFIVRIQIEYTKNIYTHLGSEKH